MPIADMIQVEEEEVEIKARGDVKRNTSSSYSQFFSIANMINFNFVIKSRICHL